jgi:gliding motility-associated-like protein
VQQQGVYSVSVQVNGCSATDSINVNYTPLPVVNLGSDTTLCQGQSLLLSVPTFNGTFIWQDGSTSNSYNVSGPGTYYVLVTENNCSNADTIAVLYNAVPSVNLGNDTTLCEGQSYLLDATTGNATYLWQDASAGPSLAALQQGIYWVQVTVDGCTGADTVSVIVTQLALVDLGIDSTICIGDIVLFNVAVPGAAYLWQDGSTGSEYQVAEAGTYSVLVTLDGCSNSDTVNVETEDCEVVIVLPNIFTPNGDGMNDIFTPTATKGISSMETLIFNRWGNEVYVTNDVLIAWDGKDGGGELVDGVYFWVVIYKDLKGKSGSLKGTVTLMK